VVLLTGDNPATGRRDGSCQHPSWRLNERSHLANLWPRPVQS
jgi:hypothetical protein